MEMRKSEPFFFSGLPLFSAAVFILIFQGAFFSPQVLGQDTPITALAHPLRVQPESVNLQGSSVLSDRFDVSYYHLTLNLNGLRNPILIGRNRIEGTAIADLDSLQFDLSTNMVVDFVSLTSGNVLKTIHQNDKLTVVLGTKLTAGKRLEMDVVYHGNPEETGFGAFSNIQNVSGKPNTIWTLSEPYGSKEWWPSDDQLTDKADSVRITVHVPAPMTVGSNGVLLSRKLNMDGSSTFDWMHRYPISPYLVSLAIGEYDEYVQSYTRPAFLQSQYGPATFPIHHFVYAGGNAFQGISPSSGWHLALEMMSVFEDWLGPYPFAKEKYGHAQVTFKGGMEHQTLSSMGNIGAELIAHELAHQWFGDKLTPLTWPHLWLNEGFATMSEFLVFESDPKYDFLNQFLGDLYFERARSATGTLVLQDTTDVGQMFDFPGVYARGYMVLRMIRGIVGDDVFKDILRTYTTRPNLEYKSVSTSDFQRVVEEVSGRSFQPFFDQWVYSGTGFPTYDVEMEALTDGNNYQAKITLHQIQAPDESSVAVYNLPVWLEITTPSRVSLVRVENDQRDQTYIIELSDSPLSVRVDPYRWLLRGESPTHVNADTESLVPEKFSMSLYPNPTSGLFYVQVQSAEPQNRITVDVVDMLGRVVLNSTADHFQTGETDLLMDGARLPSGLYPFG